MRDAVLARAARLDPDARDLLEAVAVVPGHADLALLDALAGPQTARLDACLASGMLVQSADGVGFRHELARIAVEESVGRIRKRDLHAAAPRALRDRGADVARLAHHAEAAGDAESMLRYAIAAAARGPGATLVGTWVQVAPSYVQVSFNCPEASLPPKTTTFLLTGS